MTIRNYSYKNKRGRVHTSFSLPRPVHRISSLLPFTCTTEWYENNNSARVSWTKLESAKHFIQQEKTRKNGFFIRSTVIHMRATQHFHCGLLLGTTRIKEKNFRETYWNIFGVFGFLEQANKNGKQKREKLFTRESSQQVKEEQEIFLGFHFNFYYRQGN